MPSLKTLLIIAGVIAIAYGVGREWKLKPETPQNHIVKTGEFAVLHRPGAESVWLAPAGKRAYEYQVAMVRGDDTWFYEMEARGLAFRLPVGTPVRVISESSNAREVEVLEGERIGFRGWVEFEHLKWQPDRK